MAIAVGFIVGIQAAAERDGSSRLAAESPEDLTRILADLNIEADALAQQVAALRVKLFRYRSSASREGLALQDARKALADLQVLTGVVPAIGPGVAIRISDARERVTWDAMLDLVQELRDAGAEAIAVNGQRVVASSWFGPAEGGIGIDGVATSAPFEVLAIGPPHDLGEALGIPGGPIAVLQSQPGVVVKIEERRGLNVPALRRTQSFRYAQPAE
ncbi:MAG: DUF881 domain-containing protein [Actinomycetota bacterium]